MREPGQAVHETPALLEGEQKKPGRWDNESTKDYWVWLAFQRLRSSFKCAGLHLSPRYGPAQASTFAVQDLSKGFLCTSQLGGIKPSAFEQAIRVSNSWRGAVNTLMAAEVTGWASWCHPTHDTCHIVTAVTGMDGEKPSVKCLWALYFG